MRTNSKNSKLYEKLKEDILSGICPPGFQFPPEISYARTLGVSRNTLRLNAISVGLDGWVELDGGPDSPGRQ